ncbi:MAG: OmpH family outer membrane protein [Alphaproteobacteria bacterium]|nr:MAG: OmpH family outer membrane protein [Alphaproteobacteria bacterium]
MKTNRLTLGIAALAMVAGFALATAGSAQAQAKSLSIAVFDNQKVMTSVNAVKRANDSMTAKTKDAKTRIDALEKPLLEKKKQLSAQQGVMAADKFKIETDAFMKDLENLRQQTAKIESDLNKDMFASRKRIIDGVSAAVEQVAKEKGYDIVLPKGNTIVTSANVPDITSEAIVKANLLLDK